MSKRHVALVLAVSACVAGLGESVKANEAVNQLSLEPVYAQDSGGKPGMMGMLDKMGAGGMLEEAGIVVGGWVEGSLTYSTSAPPENIITGRAFDFEHEDPTLNQAAIFIERITDFATPWDIGFRIEGGYGADYRFTHSNGMDFQVDTTEDNQFDVTQAYAELVVPIGTGLKVRVGKFITPLGWEYVNPTLNALYSHSYLFGLVPYSHTGVTGTYMVTEKLSLTLGFSRGWDQSLKDNNGDALDVLGAIAYELDEKTDYYLNATWGPEGEDSGYYKLAIDTTLSHEVSDQLTLALNAVYIYDANGSQTGEGANTWGVAGYAGFALDPDSMFVLNGRLEWMNDEMRAGGFDTNVYEGTAGVTITPFTGDELASGLKIRPEVRFDYAHDQVFDGGTQNTQWTGAIEAYFKF